MPRDKLTPKQEGFVLAYYETGNACEAYRRAYNADNMSLPSVDKEARRLLKDPRITPRLQELAERREAKAQLSLEEHMEKLAYLRDKAEEKGQMSAAITAEVKRGELRRLYVKQVGPPDPCAFLEEMSDEELENFIRKTAAGLLPDLAELKRLRVHRAKLPTHLLPPPT